MAIREVHWGIEAVTNTAATAFKLLRCADFQPKNNAPLDKPKETSGTTITLQRPRLKGRQFDFTLKMYGYHDLPCFVLACAYGAPTVTAVSGATGAFDHIFKPGGVTLKSATVRWKQTGSGGTIWFRSVGCKVKTVKFAIQANGMPMWEFSGHGRYATSISAPGAVSDTTAAYIHPIDMSQQAVTLATVAWLLPKKLDVTIENGLTPDWGIAATRDYNRLKLGDTEAKVSIEAWMDAYVGSLMEAEDGTSSLLGAIAYTATDTATDIGTGTPTKPSTTLAFPKPYVDAVSQDNSNTDQEEKGELDLAYDSTSATLITITLRNELTSSVYTGT